MTAKDLTKHMLYYQRIVQADPSNVEASLRLAAIYRESGFIGKAVDAYVSSARLLAGQGLPLEAIAACKAILELDATHTETQFFLARLYAQAPSSAGAIVQQLPKATSSSSESPSPVRGPGIVQGRVITLHQGGIRCVSNRLDEVFAVSNSRDDEPTVSGRIESMIDLESLRETLEDLPSSVREYDEYEDATTSPLEAELIPAFDGGCCDEDEYEDLSDELELLSWSDLPRRTVSDPHTLPQIPLFSQLDSAAFMELLAVTEHRVVRAGGVILDPDDVQLSLFVVIRGLARVEKDLLDGRTVRLADLGVGEFFGEFRLLTGHDGMARVVAETEMELLEIRDEVLYGLATTHPQVWDALWSLYYSRMLNNLLASSVIFERLSSAERDELASHFVLEEFLVGERLLNQGESCDAVYLVVSGEVWAEKRTNRGSLRRVDVLVGGDFVGITPCATGGVSSVSVRAVLDTVVLRLSAADFRNCLREYDDVAQAVDYVVRERRRRAGAEVIERGQHFVGD